MRYFWLLDSVAHKFSDFRYHPGQENLVDYTSKAHNGKTHRRVRSYFLHMKHSPRMLVRALMPKTCRGCGNPVKDHYINNEPLPILRGNSLRNTSMSIRNSTKIRNAPVA